MCFRSQVRGALRPSQTGAIRTVRQVAVVYQHAPDRVPRCSGVSERGWIDLPMSAWVSADKAL